MSPSPPRIRNDLAGFVLAAGRGERLRPLTDVLPKPLCPVGGVPLLDLALARLRALGLPDERIAVNVHHLGEQIVEHLRAAAPTVHIQREHPVALGTAGAIGAARLWLAGRHVLIRNADAWSRQPLGPLLDGWDGTRPRLLVEETGGPADFGSHRFVGTSLLPGPVAAALPAGPAGLYEHVWRAAYEAGELEFVEAEPGGTVDCGTPADYLSANLRASGGCSVIDPTARVQGTVERCVVLAGAVVGPEEHLVDCIRGPGGLTLAAG